MRGVSVTPYRADANPPELEPPDQAGVSPEKPRFVDERVVRQRVFVSPDPLIAGVLLRISPDDTEMIAKALYLLLPSPDYAKVVSHPAAYLCTMQAPWKEEVDGTPVSGTLVNLRLRQAPGSDLRSPTRISRDAIWPSGCAPWMPAGSPPSPRSPRRTAPNA